MMHSDRENAIKVLSSLSPSIREAIAVYVETTNDHSSGGYVVAETLADDIRSLGK